MPPYAPFPPTFNFLHGLSHGIQLILSSWNLWCFVTIKCCRLSSTRQYNHHHHHQVRVASEGRRVVAPPCPQLTACLQRSPIGRAESFRSWSTHFFLGRPGGRRHVPSGGRLSDTSMWSWSAMFTGVTLSSRATCPNTEMRRRDRRLDSEVRPFRWSTSSFRTRSYHLIPSSCLRHFWWKASRVLISADSTVQVSAITQTEQVSGICEAYNRTTV